MDQDILQNEIKNICNNIKKLRELKGYTREVMADELNLSVSGYGKIERGEVEFSIKKIFEIAHILNTDIYKILNLDTSEIFNESNNRSAISSSIDLSETNSNQAIYYKIIKERLDKLELKIKTLENLKDL